MTERQQDAKSKVDDDRRIERSCLNRDFEIERGEYRGTDGGWHTVHYCMPMIDEDIDWST